MKPPTKSDKVGDKVGDKEIEEALSEKLHVRVQVVLLLKARAILWSYFLSNVDRRRRAVTLDHIGLTRTRKDDIVDGINAWANASFLLGGDEAADVVGRILKERFTSGRAEDGGEL